MAAFGIRFFLCNICICMITGILLLVKRALKHDLTGRMQFHLWFLFLVLLTVPFLPVHPVSFSQMFQWFAHLGHAVSPDIASVAETAVNAATHGTSIRMQDFTLSVSSKIPDAIGFLLSGLWLFGMLGMLFLAAKSKSRLNNLKNSALPLQSKEVRMLYQNCLSEVNIKRNIPIYSTAFLKSPIIVGLFNPCIYLPIHLISDFNAADMRYMLLHELQHYKHKDALAGYLMNLIGILYWFNPLVWYALKEMRDDREIACDTSVLKLLGENDYEDYGKTLIRLAAKVSLTPFPFSVGISGNMKQMQKRIINISTYKKSSTWQICKELAAFGLICAILLGFTPILSTYAAENPYYKWDISTEKVSTIDVSAYFTGYKGSFVLYNLGNDTWSVSDTNRATFRTEPYSTYKIYNALFGLEEGIITPKDSFFTWDGTNYPFEAWNADQDLYSAMHASVNWYFEKISRQLGTCTSRNYIRKIGYGNENIYSDLSPFRTQSSLKISPVEQVRLLTDLYTNLFGFIPEHIQAVKDSICLFSSANCRYYGKTGTGRIDGKDVNGWFVGFVETTDNTYFFATNIQGNRNASGSNAEKITESILSELIPEK